MDGCRHAPRVWIRAGWRRAPGGTHPTGWVLNEHPLVIEAFDKGIQSIVIGEKTPEQVAKEVRQVKERELEKAKKK